LSFDKDLKPIGVESNNVVIPISSEQKKDTNLKIIKGKPVCKKNGNLF